MSELPFELPKSQVVKTIRHEAELEELGATIAFTKESLEFRDDPIGRDFLENRLRATMKGYVLAGLPKDVTARVEYPSSWWQHTKGGILENPLTLLGRWLRDRFPPKQEWVEHTESVHRRICPHDPVTDPVSKHLQWIAGPEVYTNQIEELEKSIDHWRLRAQAFERRCEDQRETHAKQAQIIRKGIGQ